ncbi:MAG TPA: TonB-dependent receptor, partial [Pyrinomonadaceae bacterium]|nr:TonB-dependent receptor [Pyrinomonadaceae bacterium]
SSAVLNGTLYQGAGLAQLQGGRQNSNNFRGEAIWTAGRGLIVDVRYSRGFMNQKLGSYGIPSDPRIICQSVPSQYIAQAGCAQGFSNISSNENVFKDVSIRDTWDASLTYVFKGLGTHEVKGGYQRNKIYNDVSTGNVFGSGGQGRTYLYYGRGLTGIDCFSIYVQWAPNCPANGRFYPLPTLPTGVSVIGSGVNYQFGTNGEATDTVDSVFLQDKWQPFRRLTLNLGVRLEKEQFPTFNTTHIDLNWDWKDKVAPRVGIAYALTGDGKTKVAGMWGKYFDRLKFSVPQNAFGGQFYHVSYFYITSDRPNYSYYTVANLHGSYTFPSGGQCPIIPTSPNGYVCDQDYRVAANVSGANALSSGAVDPDLKPYEQTETTFEFQRELFRSTVLTARYIRRELDHVIEDVGIPGPLGDAYIIGNPGEGLAAETARSLGYNKVAVPKRDYNAFQAELDTRYLKNLSLNFNYTWSRLAGNYSGLANPDELQAGGTPRMDPNLSRAFSAPWVGFTASGQPDDGALPLDRTHVFKAWGTYTFDWLRSGMNSTDLSFFTTIESGTPRTTFVNIFGVPIPETKRGDLGRTPTFSQTDLNLTHRIKFGRENRYAVALNFNVINAFNQNTVLVFDQNKTSGYWALSEGSVVTGGDTAAATNVLTSTGVLAQYAAAEQTVCAGFSICGAGVARNLAFQTPLAWQEPRSVRFGFRFIF